MGDLLGFTRNGSAYYYVRNGQNDIIGILNSDGQQVVRYEYDSWGKLLSVTGDEAETVGQLNPFRYRGYYYDSETALYYLNSRYYDPSFGRFLNADFALGVNEDLLSNNVFIYCSNNPINCYDDLGEGKLWNKIKEKATEFVNWITGNSTPPSNYSPRGQYGIPSQSNNNSSSSSSQNTYEYKTHSKNKRKSNKQTHEAGERRRGLDQGGEKGDARRKPNPNKRRLTTNISAVLTVATGLLIVCIALDDATVIGVVDDPIIIPLIKIFFDNLTKVAA